jgi:hypothetical protein
MNRAPAHIPDDWYPPDNMIAKQKVKALGMSAGLDGDHCCASWNYVDVVYDAGCSGWSCCHLCRDYQYSLFEDAPW